MAKHSKQLSPTITYSFLGIVGIAALFLGIFSIQKTVSDPSDKILAKRQQIVDEVQTRAAFEDQRLRTQDTDTDGLTDFEELSIYGTSPYLIDSDSDGFSDYEEIKTGNDPNCPSGTNCRSIPAGAVGSQEQNSQDTFLTDQFSDLLEAPTVEEVPTIDLTSLSPAEVRQLLVDSGEVTAQQLESIDDETLMSIYSEVINEVGGEL